jgi:hypothetical protein
MAQTPLNHPISQPTMNDVIAIAILVIIALLLQRACGGIARACIIVSLIHTIICMSSC